MNEKNNNCPHCQSPLDSNLIVCSNCGKITFPIKDDSISSLKYYLIIFGYFLTFLIFGLIAGSIIQKINKGGIFTTWDTGMITLGIIIGKYIADRRGNSQLLWIILSGTCSTLIGSLLYSNFVQYYYLDLIMSLINGFFVSSFIGLAISITKNNNLKRIIGIFFAGLLGGIIANSINGTIIELKIVEMFSLQSLYVNSIYGAKAGFVIAICFLIAYRFTQYKNAFINAAYVSIGTMICGGILGAIADAANFNPYWSGLFEVQENIFLSIRMGFFRDGIICGSIALGIIFMNTFSKKEERIKLYMFNMIGGAIGGWLAIYILLSFPLDIISFSSIERVFYNMLRIENISNRLWLTLGGIFGFFLALGITFFRENFNGNSLSHLKKISTQSLGGSIGGTVAGIICGIIIILKSASGINFKVTIALIFLISVICSIYGLLIALGMTLTRNEV